MTDPSHSEEDTDDRASTQDNAEQALEQEKRREREPPGPEEDAQDDYANTETRVSDSDR